MASLNYALREINFKIVYYGPGLGGKTTNLEYIYQSISPSYKGKMISLMTEQERTLFFDFLPLELGKIKGFTTRVHLYTVPGQEYYEASRKLILKGADGVVFIVDSQKHRLNENVNSYNELLLRLKEYQLDVDTLPCVVQYNKRDLSDINPVCQLEETINIHKKPSFEAVAIKGIGVFATIKVICKSVIEKFELNV
ncbi:gliding-motility protein MglA [bacterium]|nr:gliding-motility protein MglA [bacterium]